MRLLGCETVVVSGLQSSFLLLGCICGLWGRQGPHSKVNWADWCCSMYGSGGFSVVSCGSSGASPRQLGLETHHVVSTAQKWRGSHHCFGLRRREIGRIPLTESSKAIGQGGVGFGCGQLFAASVCHGGRLLALSRQHGAAEVTTHGQGRFVAP